MIACASVQLKDAPVAARILETDIALFRDETAKPRALLDRCCHRGLPLTRGKKKDGRIICGFHGWEFDSTGLCARIPSLCPGETIPKSFRVPSYHCEEKDGYVWVWMGDQNAEKAPVPSIPELAIKTERWLQGYRLIDCSYLRALEITYDGSHVHFVHPTHPATLAAQKSGFKEGLAEIRTTKTGCIAFAPAAKSGNDPIPARSFVMEFTLPNRIRFAWPAPDKTYFMYWHATPISENKCRLDWLISNPFPGGDAFQWIDQGREPLKMENKGMVREIIDEDHSVLELIQRVYEREGENFECSVEADIPTLTLRRIAKAAAAGRWNPQDWELPKRRLIRTMAAA